MNLKIFDEQVRVFEFCCIDGCMQEYEAEFDIKALTARVHCTDYMGHKWVIPIYVNSRDYPCIDSCKIGGGDLPLDSESLYYYLWRLVETEKEVQC